MGAPHGLPMVHSNNNHNHKLIVVLYPLLKGSVMAGVTLWILGTTFYQSLVITTVSGALGIVGIVLGAYMASREARKNREILHDIKRNTETDRREGDFPQ